jgi:Family of unknown function (DUF6519)
MKGDFSRDTFKPERHYARVLMQQGRVQVDADWNEQASILLHHLRTMAMDVIGPHGGPMANPGFEIVTKDSLKLRLDTEINPTEKKRLEGILGGITFLIRAGRYYVNGLLCENETDIAGNAQTDHPDATLEFDALKDKDLLFYLDVWEHHVTALEDEFIREDALGGPDTATRARIVWQVRLAEATEIMSLTGVGDQTWQEWFASLEGNRPQLKARTAPGPVPTDPCTIAPESQYRGPENQLYRVEVHQGSSESKDPLKPVTFKFSRENGSILTSILPGSSTDRLEVVSTRGFAAHDWIELLSNEHELERKPGPLVQVLRVDDGALVIQGLTDVTNFSKVRRWDQVASKDQKLLDGAIAINDQAETWIKLENSIEVQFNPTLKANYRTGDYWLIPARVIGGEIEWPTVPVIGGESIPQSLEPHGVKHYFAPLALLRTGDGAQLIDLRHKFSPLVTTVT